MFVITINEFTNKELIKIVDVSTILYGDSMWKNGDVVEIKDVDVYENRIEVWNKNKFLSEFIYGYELNGIEKVNTETQK